MLVHDGAGDASPDERRRVRWLQYYIGSHEYEKATNLVTTPAENAIVLKARAMRASGFCTCIPDAGKIEAERLQAFKVAIITYEWEVGEILAYSAEEQQDVADSRTRVEVLEKALSAGDFALASRFAITQAEQDRVKSAAAGQ